MNTEKTTDIFLLVKRLLYALFILIAAPIYLYATLPVLNFWFISFAWGLLMVSIVVVFLEIVFIKRSSGWLLYTAGTVAVFSILHLLFTSLFSSEMFRAGSYQQLLGSVKTVKATEFSGDVAPVSLDKIRIIDQDVAHRLGDKVIGEQPSLGSQTHIGTFNIQSVNGDLVWVAPLLHSGFFKWWSNAEGTPAYVIVSATNERDVRLVTAVKGRPIRIKYQTDAFFGSNLERHLYFSGYASTGMADYTFEIDDEGTPHWVVSLYSNTIGFFGENVYGIAVVNAETGEIKEYGIDDAPAWVDRVQPKEFIIEQLDNWGTYINGYWNFSKEGILQTTEGMSLVYGHDGRSYWYTGITSAGREQGTVGFVLVDTRNKSTTWYQQAGATEEAAMQSAKGKVQEKGYEASFPILYNITGIPTYVLSLKDKAGLIKMIALVSVEDYSIVGVGDNLKEAHRAYLEAYKGTSPNGSFNLSNNQRKLQHTARISRIATDVVGGNAFYYLYADYPANKVFVGSSTLSPTLPLTQVGDSVLLTYSDARTESIELHDFLNLSIRLATTDSIKIQ